METQSATLDRFVPLTQVDAVTLLDVSPSHEASLKQWLSSSQRTADKQYLKHINVTLKLSLPEYVWTELMEYCVTGAIPLGRVTVIKKSWEHVEVQSFRSSPHGRSSIPSDRLAREGEVHLKFEKLFDTILETSQEFRGLGVSEEQISILMPRTRKYEILWGLDLGECLEVLKLSGKENVLWEVREFAISLREVLKEGIVGFGHIGGLS
ncbi:MAG: FAD-dependent thymidylate synthase [Pseudomonadota bacterium]